MLTARAEPEQRIEGLETGVDDYLAKPFEPRELLLRVSNVLRRGGSRARLRRGAHGRIRVSHLAAASSKRQARRSVSPSASATCLRYFAQRPGMPVSRHELAKDDGDNGGERAIDVQINRLRRKIEHDPANPVYLQTVRGKGYILYPE